MGHWKLPNTVGDAETLRDIIAHGLPAQNASEVLYGVLGSDDLFDRLSKARKMHPSWDVAPLVVNAIAEIYFTGSNPADFASADTVEILRGLVDGHAADHRDIFFRLAKIENADQAMDSFAHWLEIRRQDRAHWDVARDPNGYDFIARNGEWTMFRLSAIDDYAMEIDPANADIYSALFATTPSATH